MRAARLGVGAMVLLAHVLGSPAVAAPRTETVALSEMGEADEKPVYWDFRIDAARRAGAWTKIRVPSCWEQEGFGAYYYGTQGRGKADDDPIIPRERGEYRTEFFVPARWRGRSIRIVFDGVMTDTDVRINGRPAGATHQGGFYRFHYDITPLVKLGANNSLEVAVAKESANPTVNRAERRGDYWTFGGIYRPVWLEARPRHSIEWTAIDARADGTFSTRIHLASPAPPGSTVQARIIDAAGAHVGPSFSAPVDADNLGALLSGKIDKPRAWSAEAPQLYAMQLALIAPSANGSRAVILHETSERFGFRTFEVRARDGLYLNGSKIVLKGINRHSFSPATGRTLSRERSYRDVRLIKEANMNAVRMAHYPPDRHFLEVADELGLYVLDELAGWQGFYDTATGARLIGQMVRRDVNHPSILFWDNGNEGGWNQEVDGEFARWDPQGRPVLHPWATHSGINTDHYEGYASTVRLSQGPEIFMPTEFLHGLYDGGIGAGLRDYWNVMSASPTVGGGFFWAFADEGIERTDRNRRIDNMGNAAADGMLGPYGEKEGSFYAVKEIWSPVQIADLQLDRQRAALRMTVANRYDFTDLRQGAITWRALKLPRASGPSEHRLVIAEGEVSGPALAPGQQTAWELPVDLQKVVEADVVHLTALDPQRRELWTWSLPLVAAGSRSEPLAAQQTSVAIAPASAGRRTVKSDPYELTFDMQSGRLVELRTSGALFPLSGPHLIAFKRTGRSFDDVSTPQRLQRMELSDGPATEGMLARATYDGTLRNVTWSRSGDALAVSYEIAHIGAIDILGVRFDVPEAEVTSKRWVGNGPYRIWQNRLGGGVFDLHETRYNDPTPAETYSYPEFKGYFGQWHWLTLQTSSGSITARNVGAIPYFGLYRPRAGINPLLELPDVGWSFLHVIPAVGTKFDLPDALGPQSQSRQISGVQRGEVELTLPAFPPASRSTR